MTAFLKLVQLSTDLTVKNRKKLNKFVLSPNKKKKQQFRFDPKQRLLEAFRLMSSINLKS